jgi:hypothetical protein
MTSRRLATTGLLGAMIVLALTTTPDAQERVRLYGTVQWIGSNAMQVMTASGSFPVDLSEAEQSSYQGLRSGAVVVVDGVVSTDRRRVIASQVWRDETGSQGP